MIDTAFLRAIETNTTHAFNKMVSDSVEWRKLYPVLLSFISKSGYWISADPKKSDVHLELYVQSVYKRNEDQPIFSSVSEAACFEYILNQIKEANNANSDR